MLMDNGRKSRMAGAPVNGGEVGTDGGDVGTIAGACGAGVGVGFGVGVGVGASVGVGVGTVVGVRVGVGCWGDVDCAVVVGEPQAARKALMIIIHKTTMKVLSSVWVW